MSFANELPVPAVALIIQDADYAGRPLVANFTESIDGDPGIAVIFTANRSLQISSPDFLYQESFQIDGFGSFTAVVANASGLRPSIGPPLGSGIQISSPVTCKCLAILLLPLVIRNNINPRQLHPCINCAIPTPDPVSRFRPTHVPYQDCRVRSRSNAFQYGEPFIAPKNVS